MKVADFLNLTDAAVDVVVTDKQELLEELAVRAAARIGLRPERILSELVKREQPGSTGIGGGVAIPHTRLHEVERLLPSLFRAGLKNLNRKVSGASA